MPAPQSFNKILLTTSNNSENNILLQEISGQLYINNHLVVTSDNIASLTTVTDLGSDVSTLQTDVSTLDTSVTSLQTDVSTLQTDVSTLQTNEDSLTNTYSLSFDGTDDQVRTFHNFESMFQSSFSISAWGKLSDTSGLKFWFGLNVSGSSRYQLYFSNSTLYSFIESGGTNGDTLNSNSSDASFTDWFHVCVTYEQNGSNLIQKMYINGSFVDSGTTSIDLSNFSNTSQNMLIGSRTTAGQYVWNGLMDEIAFFDSALSSSDVTAIYNSGIPTNLTNLNPLHWWRMGDNNEGTGTTITDQGSGSVDLALFNNPTFSTDVLGEPEPFSNTYSLSFDGTNDYLDAGTSSDYSILGGGSLSYWVYPSFTGAPTYLESISKRSSAGFQVTHAKSGSTYNVAVYNHAFNGGYPVVNLPTENQWYLITIVFHASGGATLYKNDGASGSSGTGQTSTKTSYSYTEDASAPLYIGRHPTSLSRCYKGLIDECAIFNNELTESEVAAIYNSGVADDLASYNPTSWWRMGDNNSGTGTTVSNQGSGGNDATLTNGPTFSTTIPS